MKNEKRLIFDMDGTIADFYMVENWLDYIHNENPYPYKAAAPIYDMKMLNALLLFLKTLGWKIVITTWLAKNASSEYDNEVRKAKKEWLEKYNFPYDEIHMVKYGTTKADCTRKKGGVQILIDDNNKILEGWNLGDTIDAKTNIVNALLKLAMD